MTMELDISRTRARELVEVLQGENDIVRIVDPVSRKILYWPAVERGELDCPCYECNAVWGRSRRCPNCTSLEAVQLMQRTFKIELNNNRAFWVQSRPMVVDGAKCVLETVNDVTDGLMVEGSDRGSVTNLIDSLNSLIVTDALTSLLNRRFLDEFTLRLPDIERAGTRVNVAMLDLDDMKDINDGYGHPAGDAVLKDVAGFLKLHFSVRDGGRERYAIRYGGDEFIVVDLGGDFAAFEDDVRERYAEMRRVCYYGVDEIAFTLSIGTASSDEFGWDWAALLDAADQRMYAAKRSLR